MKGYCLTTSICISYDISAIIIGEGQDRQALEGTARMLGLSDRVIFTGWVKPDIVSAYLAAGDIFVSPSRTEAQGLTVIEAMIAKTPVITARVGGIVDSVRHEETGLLVNERSPDEIAKAIERLVREPFLADHLREQGYKLAVNKFSRASSAESFSSLFDRMIQIKKPRHVDKKLE